MRIFIAVRHAQDPAAFHSTLWSRNFYPALRKLGHTLVESQVDVEPASRFMQVASDFTPEERALRGRITEQIVDEVKAAHAEEPVDLFLSYFYNAHFEPSGFDAVHDLGIPTVNFYCNSMYQFDLVRDVAPAAEWAWHAERPAREAYQSVGATPVWVQMGANPQEYYPIDGMERQNKACFVGRKYADRDRLVAALVRDDVPLDIYGSGWKASASSSDRENATTHLGRQHAAPGSWDAYRNVVAENIEHDGIAGGLARTVRQWAYRRRTQELQDVISPVLRGYADDITETFNAYDVVLNFSNVWADGRTGSPLIPHVRMRDFEAPMCRACYLTGHNDEIEAFYEIGEEIDTYASQEELVDKTRYYLAHPRRAEALRKAGYERAMRDHTWSHRFEELFHKIGLLA